MLIPSDWILVQLSCILDPLYDSVWRRHLTNTGLWRIMSYSWKHNVNMIMNMNMWAFQLKDPFKIIFSGLLRIMSTSMSMTSTWTLKWIWRWAVFYYFTIQQSPFQDFFQIIKYLENWKFPSLVFFFPRPILSNLVGDPSARCIYSN